MPKGFLQRGFTLVELILALVIIGIAVAGLTVTFHQVLKERHGPEIRNIATALAVKEAERVIRSGFGNVADENRDNPTAYSGNFTNYSWQVRVDNVDTAQPTWGISDPTMANYKVVEVRVHNSAIGYVSLIFLKTNYRN